MPEPYPREGCAWQITRSQMATLNAHKTAKTAAISCLAADVPAAQGGATAPRCVPAPREDRSGAPGQPGQCPELTPSATLKGKGPTLFIFSPGLFCLMQAGGQRCRAHTSVPSTRAHKLRPQLSQTHQQRQPQVPPAPQGEL